MRILQVTKNWRPNGGVAVYVRDLARALAEAGHEVAVVHADPGAPAIGAGVREIAIRGLADDGASAERQTGDALRAIDAFEPDVVHVHACNNFGLERELRARYPALKTLHNYDFCPADTKYHFALGRPCHHRTGVWCLGRMAYKRCVLSRRPRVLWQMYRRATRANRHNAGYPVLVVASEYVRRQAVATGYRLEQVRTLPYFTSVPGVASVPSERSNSRTIFFCGRLGPEKGLPLLLRALPRLRGSWRLVVAGDGSERARAERLAQRLGIAERVDFRGWADRGTLDVLYQEAAVVAMPSRWPEPFGIAGLEALAYERPVVAFAVGGIPEWLDDGETGFLVPPYDLEMFAERLQRVLDNPSLGARMGARGRERVRKNFSSGVHLARLVAEYERVAGLKAKRGRDSVG